MQRIKAMLADLDRPIKWLFYGDSITHGALHTFGWRDYTQLFAERIRYEMSRSGDIVINTAVSGNTTRELIDEFDWRAGQFEATVALLMIGMNDCCPKNNVSLERFTDNLHTLADRFAATGTLLVAQTTSLILPGSASDREPYLGEYMQAVRDFANQRGLPLVDHASHWQDDLARLYYWQSDPFHPNEMGHRALAFKLFEEFGIMDDESPICRLFRA